MFPTITDSRINKTASVQVTGHALFWIMNSKSFNTKREYPALMQVAKGWTVKQRVIELPGANQWSTWLLTRYLRKLSNLYSSPGNFHIETGI